MIVATAQLKLYAPWVHTLKEKRMEVKSLISKIKNKYNVSVAEVEEQDTHQTIVIGIACVSDTMSFAQSLIDHVIKFVEDHSQGEIVNILREIR